MDRRELADFLRHRREALQPEDVGLGRGVRRRTRGLRREEVARLASMSTDYYGRLEQQRGPQPSREMLGAIARGLRLSQDERDHLFRLAGHQAPDRSYRSDHVSPALMRVLDRLDTPAQVVSDIGETLAQNALSVALVGDQLSFDGLSRFVAYRWFTDPDARRGYPEADHEQHGRFYTTGLRMALARQPGDPVVLDLVARLRAASEEFEGIWAEHEILTRPAERKRMLHPSIGLVELHCQTLVAENAAQVLLVYTATPGTADHEKLQLLAVIGSERFDAASRL